MSRLRIFWISVIITIYFYVANAETIGNRVSKIAQQYSNWALGKVEQNLNNQFHPPRFYNSAPVKQFVHSVKIYPPPPKKQETMLRQQLTVPVQRIPSSFPVSHERTTMPNPLNGPQSSRIVSEIRRKPPADPQQIPPPIAFSDLPKVFHHSPLKNSEAKFPRLLEFNVPPPPPTPFATLFPPNASTLPSHMIDFLVPPPPISHPIDSPIIVDQLLPPPVVDQAEIENKEEVLKMAGKKQKYGWPRFLPPPPPPMQPMVMPPRNLLQPLSNSPCMSGWCGGECCDTQPHHHHSPISTTIQATALPGSPTPPHPLVLVVHPAIPQCSPDCQPHCNPQCVARVQYIQESQYFNSIQQPMCRTDCMPSCHVECLIIPPERVRCNSMRCQCAAGYIQCAAFTCCMRYPSMAAKMRAKAKSEETSSSAEQEDEPVFEKQFSPFKTKNPYNSTKATTTTTTTTIAPITTTTPNRTEIHVTPIYRESQPRRTVPMIPAYEIWTIPEDQRRKVGDVRGRHVIRSENFLDVLGQLAQVKLREDINEDFSNAQSLLEFVTDNIRKS